MKRILLFFTLIFTIFLQAQTTAIPDPNFEQVLIQKGLDDVIDGQVLTANISGETSLNLQFSSLAYFITDYTGIEGFSSLQSINFGKTSASSIDLSNNINLTIVTIGSNSGSLAGLSFNLTSINLSGLSQLRIFQCYLTPIADIDFSENLLLEVIDLDENPQLLSLDLIELSLLKSFSCKDSQLSNLNVSANLDLEHLSVIENNITSIDISNNTLLKSLSISRNQISSLDISNNSLLEVLSCSENLLTNLDVSNKPNLISLFCSGNQISSLDITSNLLLENLYCQENNITELNVSNNNALVRLFCFENQIPSLDLENKSELFELRCESNQLTNILFGQNTNLLFAYCQDNPNLADFDVSGCISLLEFFCNNTAITNLDMTQNTAITDIRCFGNPLLESVNIKNGNNESIFSFQAQACSILSCIQVDDPVAASVHLAWNEDDITLYNEHCLDTYVPDDNFEQALINLGYDSGVLDDYVRRADIESVLTLNVENESIADLTGIEDFLDLEQLRCRNNEIVNLDLSNNTNLTFLRLEDNLLENLNLKNGNNGILTTMRAEDNNLLCVEVDDEVSANAGTGSYSSWQVGTGVIYSERCGGCPEIDLLGNGISIANGDDTPVESDNTDFGLVDFGSFIEFTFILENLGTADLLLAGTPLITITNSTDFEVVEFPDATIAADGGTTSFTIRYTPSMVNTINTATIAFSSDDCDNAIYSFDVVGQSQEALGLETSSLNKALSIYPNPNQGKFVLKYSGQKELDQMTVFDITGKQIQTHSIRDFNTQQTFNLKLSTGFYFIKISANNESIIKKIIIN